MTTKIKESRYPRLHALIESRQAWINEHDEVEATAADGTIVQLGNAWQADRVESYLWENPTSDLW